MAVDPARDSAIPEDPQSWNRYSYTRNNPINARDPNGRKDTRNEEDKRILNDPDVQKDAQKAWKESNPQNDPDKTQEAGFAVVEGADGIETTGVTTDGSPTSVDLPKPDSQGACGNPCVGGKDALAAVHTHPAAGREATNPKTGKKEFVKHEQSAKDQQTARDTGVTSYAITNQGVFRFNPAIDNSPVRVLSGGDFKEYMSGD